MKAHVLYCRLTHILRQRNALFTLVALLLLLNFVQAFTTLFKSHRVVVVPPTTTREFWIEGNRVSASYLEEMALFFGSLLLDVSPESAAYKRDLVLRNTVAEGYGALKAKLCADERRLKKERVVTSFQPNTVKVFADHMTVHMTGDLLRFLGAKRISQSRDTYVLTFVYRNHRLLIRSFELKRNDHA